MALLAERAIVALGLCVVSLGIAAAVLFAPWYARSLALRVSERAQSGLSASETVQTAELVRAFVTRLDVDALPSAVSGRTAFDGAAVAHLLDVRAVVHGARKATLALAVVLLAWALMSVRSARFHAVGSALRAGGALCLVLPVAFGLGTTLAFDWLFTAFHGVFFRAGTWVFPADSLLIQLFPESFWVLSAMSLALLVLLQGVAMWLLGGALLSRAPANPEAL